MAEDIVSYRLLDKVISDFAEREGNTRTLTEALYIVSAISRAGLVVLPTEPSAAMLAAGARVAGVPATTVRAMLEAIIRAAG